MDIPLITVLARFYLMILRFFLNNHVIEYLVGFKFMKNIQEQFEIIQHRKAKEHKLTTSFNSYILVKINSIILYLNNNIKHKRLFQE